MIAERAVEAASAAGATQAEATFSSSERFHAEARDQVLTKLEQTTGRSLTVRVFVAGAKAALSTTDLSLVGVNELARTTVEAARFVAADPHAGLPASVAPAASTGLKIFHADVAQRDAAEKIEDARALERHARAVDPRVGNSNGSRAGDANVIVALANSLGFRGTYRSTTVTRSSSPVVDDGTAKRTASYGSAARSYAAIEPVETVAQLAARRALEMCGARKPPTGRMPVIFERDVAAAVLSDVFGALSAANVAAGNSFLIDRIGERLGSELVTIVDDGRLPAGLGTSPFDAEGVPTGRTVVFDRGIFRTFLYDTYYGRKLGAASTANAAGGGIGPNNLHLSAGSHSLEELIAMTPRGVLVLDTIGFATESVTGNYSRGARGILIEGGERAYPVDEFTIAGNLASMLGAIDAVGADLKFDSTIVAPSFRVAEMTVSGA